MARTGSALRGLAWNDKFHVALSMPAFALFGLCIASYTVVMLIFAGIYVALDGPHSECGIAPAGLWPTFYNAFAFSLETMTTIG